MNLRKNIVLALASMTVLFGTASYAKASAFSEEIKIFERLPIIPSTISASSLNFQPARNVQNIISVNGHPLINSQGVWVGPKTGMQGPAGPQGLQGLQGTQGPAGAAGARGLAGPTGATGLPGVAGPQGPSGANGRDGAQGPAGSVGAAGANGKDGAQGPAGPTGLPGVAGAQGPAGPTGLPGVAGTQGPAGAAGLAGANGKDGAQGATGATGPAGANGKDGAQGPAGPSGLTSVSTDSTLTGTGTTNAPLSVANPNFGNQTGNAAAGTSSSSYGVVGEVRLTAGTVAGGLPCNGQYLSISQNQVLFVLIGTTYGGDGMTNFRLPDLRKIAPNNMTYYIIVNGIFPNRS